MAVNGVSATAVGATAVGALLVWSGIKGANITTDLRDLISGQKPSDANTTNLVGTPSGSTASKNPFGGGTFPAGDTGAHNAGAAANQANARLQAAAYGWGTGQEWSDLVSLWNRESGWSNTAQNPGSTAFGIAQFLDTTWAGYGPKTSSATLQIRYGLKYIKDRYGSPSAAWAHENSAGWY